VQASFAGEAPLVNADMPLSQLTESLREDAAVSLSASVISDERALRDLETDWNRLSESSTNPNAFMTYGWYRAWLTAQLKEIGDGRTQPHVIVLRNGDEIAGIVPMVRRIASRWLRVRKLRFASEHADYHDFLVGDDAESLIVSFADQLRNTADEWDVVDLRELRDTGSSKVVIERELKRAGLRYLILPEQHGCPWLHVSGNAETLMKRHSGHVRRTMRKRSERAASEGFRVRIVENPQDEPGLLEKLIALDWKKHLHKTSPTFLARFPEAFRSLIETLGPRGWLYVALLENDTEAIAFQIGFRCGDKLWDYTKAYDRSFSRLAPGTLILPDLLDYAHAQGFCEYDFLRGEEPYKLEWSDGCHRQFRLLIWNPRRTSRVKKFFYYDIKNAMDRYRKKQT
jgi:CelD/BcsL family acetyltransferase involved in cellulose biosynthesis